MVCARSIWQKNKVDCNIGTFKWDNLHNIGREKRRMKLTCLLFKVMCFSETWTSEIDRSRGGESCEVKWVLQLCPTLCNLMDYTVHGILQARIQEWVAFPFSRGSSLPRDGTQVSSMAGRLFTSWATMESWEGA